jgi:hypothetical protein
MKEKSSDPIEGSRLRTTFSRPIRLSATVAANSVSSGWLIVAG